MMYMIIIYIRTQYGGILLLYFGVEGGIGTTFTFLPALAWPFIDP